VGEKRKKEPFRRKKPSEGERGGKSTDGGDALSPIGRENVLVNMKGKEKNATKDVGDRGNWTLT